MRRCPHCQAANPASARFCQRCGEGMPRVLPEAFWARSDWFDRRAFLATGWPLLAVLAFRLSFGPYLVVGLERREWRFFTFHLLHGLIFGTGLAWMHGELKRERAWRWIVAGIVAGLFAEGVEYWYSYGHVMQTVAFRVVEWWQGTAAAGMVPYRSLQGLRLAGIALPLGLAWLFWDRPRPGRVLAAWVGALVAVGLRSHVIGYPLSWGLFYRGLGLENLALYAFSAFLLLYALGPHGKALTRNAENP